MAIDTGVDISCYPDYDPLGTLASGNVALCQRLARRYTNPRGAWFWAPNECTDIRAYANETWTNAKSLQCKNDLEREALHEEAVVYVNADVTFNSTTFTLTIHLSGATSTDGPFNYVLAVTSVTLSILKAG